MIVLLNIVLWFMTFCVVIDFHVATVFKRYITLRISVRYRTASRWKEKNHSRVQGIGKTFELV